MATLGTDVQKGYCSILVRPIFKENYEKFAISIENFEFYM